VRRAAGLLAASACLAAIAACSDLSIDLAIGRIATPIANPSFSRDIQPILAETCASSGACHSGANARNGLNLDRDSAYSSLSDSAVAFKPAARLRVNPNFPDSSLFYVLLSDTGASRLTYFRMPLTRFPLPPPVVETIRNWINNGAPDN